VVVFVEGAARPLVSADVEDEEFAVDAAVASGRVLFRQA
jgi:hypothetical protein